MSMINNHNNFEGLEKRQQEVSTLILVGLLFLHCVKEKTFSNTELVSVFWRECLLERAEIILFAVPC